MKTSAITLVAALTAAGLCFGTAAQAQDADTLSGIDITAERLPNFTPVAVSGAVLESNRTTLVLQRADGVVHAQIPMAPVIDESNNIRNLSSELQIGDTVTVFGHLQKSGDVTTVKADGIYAEKSPMHATLYMLDQPRSEMLNKNNPVLPVDMTLRRYQANFTPL